MSFNTEPLISVGIPTYNRPELLKKALQSLSKQEYSNIEIVVGDNSNADIAPLVQEICQSFQDNFASLKYFAHSENIGATRNFFFVFHQSSGKYFMWMADDYQMIDTSYFSILSREIGENTLIFPLYVLSHLGESFSTELFDVYESFGNKNQYLEAWCNNGTGYPVYGLFNRELLEQGNYLSLMEKCIDWNYFSEGLFLYKLFIDNTVKYCQSARMFVDTSSSNLSNCTKEDLVRDFCKYTFEVIKLIQVSELEISRKERIFEVLLQNHSDYFSHLLVEN